MVIKFIFRTEYIILRTLVYPMIWSNLHTVSWISFFVYLYDVPCASFDIHIVAEKNFLFYFVLAFRFNNLPV